MKKCMLVSFSHLIEKQKIEAFINRQIEDTIVYPDQIDDTIEVVPQVQSLIACALFDIMRIIAASNAHETTVYVILPNKGTEAALLYEGLRQHIQRLRLVRFHRLPDTDEDIVVEVI